MTKSRTFRHKLWALFETAETFLVALAAVIIVRTFIAQPFLVSGASMEPNFYDGHYLLIDELTYRFRTPERGEVVVFRYPKNHRTFYIKRIIGLPGETVSMAGGRITVVSPDGARRTLEEPYLPQSGEGSFGRTLGEGEYFVMGDNRSFSFDSRNWGPVKKSELVGIVRLRLWPINQVMAFTAPAY